MKIAFVFLNPDLFRHFEKVVRLAMERGHTVDLIVDLAASNTPNPTGRALAKFLDEGHEVSLHPLLRRTDLWRKPLSLARELINYAFFYKPQHPSIDLKNRWKKYLPPLVWRVVGNPIFGRLLAQPISIRLLRLVERIAPPDRAIMQWLQESAPDVIFASPFITPGSLELEYVKAAKHVGITTIVAVTSWDNLTTKGTFHVLPDHVFLWNKALFQEAVDIHEIPAERIYITGSPTFDYWFEEAFDEDRDEFYAQAGLRPESPFLVYLCSSRGMIQNEVGFIQDLASELARTPATRDLSILVRPHPLNTLNWDAHDHQNITVWPVNGEFTDTEEARQRYHQTLANCSLTLGINTSAMIETAIMDKPCLSVIDDRYRGSQTGMGHFRHLLEGGFLYTAGSYSEAVGIIASILNAVDEKREARQKFVGEFVRPRGLETSASLVMVEAIERVAHGTPCESHLAAGVGSPDRSHQKQQE